jgi:hypothetical protein
VQHAYDPALQEISHCIAILAAEHLLAPSPPAKHATRCAAESDAGIAAPAKTMARKNARPQVSRPIPIRSP